jgi:cyclic beta-1,2-glucan synthetase
MLTTVEALERHEGHLLNWYDTQKLAPLLPRYLSTVDSGNLAGALVALAEGCRS